MTKTRSLLASAFLAAFAAPLAADTFVLDRGHSEASFQVRHLVNKVRGRFTDFDATVNMVAGRPEVSTVEFQVKAASVDTDNEKRDAHLKGPDFFDAEKYPTISFRSTSIKPSGKDRYAVTGILSMHGVSRPITLPVTFLGFAKDPWGNDKAGFETEVTINRKDFGMVWNKALEAGGWLVDDEVRVTISLETNRAKEPAGTN